MTPRNIRNNNPLNIRRSKDKWQGLDAKQSDSSFFKFESMEMGWRAAFVILTKTYYHKYRLFTIRKIISRWAPPAENDTEAYIKRYQTLRVSIPTSHWAFPRSIPHAGWLSVWRWLSLRAVVSPTSSP